MKRVNAREILAGPELHRKPMGSTAQGTEVQDEIGTTEAQVGQTYGESSEGERTAFFALAKYRGGKDEPDRREEMFVRALRGEAEDVRFDVARGDFAAIEGAPLAYRRIGLVAHLFRERSSLDPSYGTALVGLQTSDDPRFVRCRWEIPIQNIGRDRPWAPFAKGGEYCRFYADVYLVVFWEDNGRAIRGFPEAYIRNERYYFRPGLTWPRRTQRGFNLRVLPDGCIFADMGPAIFPHREEETFYLLGVASSAAAEYLLRGLMSFGTWQVGVIKRLPVPSPMPQKRDRIGHLAKSIHDAKAYWGWGNEISTHFTKPWILQEDLIDSDSSIPERLDRLVAFEAAEDARIQKLYNEINDEVYHLYGILDTTRQAIEESLYERPPEIIWPQMERKDVAQKRTEHVWRLLSYVVKRVVEADEDGIVPFLAISGELSLIDRVYHELEALFPDRPVTQVEVEIRNELKRKVKGYRRTEGLQEWLEDVFFDYHASLYKNRPILWHIASKPASEGSAAFGALIHYHRFDKDRMAKLRGSYLRDAISLFRREAGLAAQEGRADDRLEWQARIEEAEALDERLRLVQEGHHEGPEGGDWDYRILTPWKSPAERPLGWMLDIDDGVKVNLDPLQKAGVLRKNDIVG